ncbi:MAG: 4-(cytidine 5'-diphospho)-2-C-methyl-D-erythritol kinase [Spirochaetales bacterium]|nr:4-(cytidine 5'-diphospho)-2-C-methyl-D-erythritol kinase [Spirochaetales bacterium]
MIAVPSPAKVNLYLNVVSRYKNGYHGLRSIFAQTDLSDTMTFSVADGSHNDITVGNAELPQDNLISKAVNLFQSTLRRIPFHVSIHTEKHIPMGGGLGGGSSNAATVLNVLNTMYKTNYSHTILQRMGAKLGADVPFFVRGGVQRVFGIGQIVCPLSAKCDIPILLVFPKTRVNTAAAYAAMDNCHICGNTYSEDKCYRLVRDGLLTGDIEQVAAGLYNKFETVIFPDNPELQRIKSDLVRCGAIAALMSGSGSTMFGLCENASVLHDCADKMRKLGYEVFETQIKQNLNQ